MPNVSVTTKTNDGTTVTLSGARSDGTTVQVKNGNTVLATDSAAGTTWTCSFPAAGNGTVTVHGGAKTLTVVVPPAVMPPPGGP